jgi:hypothetical protein
MRERKERIQITLGVDWGTAHSFEIRITNTKIRNILTATNGDSTLCQEKFFKALNIVGEKIMENAL